MMKFVHLSIVMIIFSSSFLHALEIKKLKTLSNEYYGANPEAYRKSMENIKIPSIPGSDINDPLLRMAFYRNQSNEYLKSLGENDDLCVITINQYQWQVPSVAVMSNGLIASGSAGLSIKVWDLSRPEGERCVDELEFKHDGHVNCLMTLPGRRVVSSNDSTIKVWNLSRPKEEQCEVTLKNFLGAVGLVKRLTDGRLVSTSDNGDIIVWGLNQPQGDECMIVMGGGRPEGHKGRVNAIRELLDGRLVSGSSDKTIKVWDLSIASDTRFQLEEDETLEGKIISRSVPMPIGCQETLTGHKDCVTSLLVLPDGRLVSGSYDNTIKLWDLSKPQGERCMATLTGHEGRVHTLTLLPDGRLVSGSSDHTIKVWDLSNPGGEPCVGTLIGHASVVTCVRVMLDGRVVSSSADHTVKVWNLSDTKVGG